MKRKAIVLMALLLVMVLGCGKKPTNTAQSTSDNQPSTSSPPPAAEQTPPPPAEQSAAEKQAQSPPKQIAETPKPKPAPPPAPKPIVVPAGTPVTVQLSQSISTKTAEQGNTFEGRTAQPITIGGKSVIPAGTVVHGAVVQSKSPGKFKGEGVLAIKLTQIAIAGAAYPFDTEPATVTVKGKGSRTAKFVGGGAAGGALIGGLAGGGKGAAIGALAGGGAGTAGAAMTGNKELSFPAETAVTFRSKQPLTLKPQRTQEAEQEAPTPQPH